MNIVLATAPHRDSPWNAQSFPPLGLLYVAGGLRSAPWAHLKVVDTYGEGLDVDESVERLLALHPDVVGVTVTSRNVEEARLLISQLKASRPQVVTVAGGHHPTLFDRLMLTRIPELDFCLRGEGDESFAALCGRLFKGEDVAGLPGLSYRREGSIVRGEIQLMEGLDSLPFPERGLLEYDGYGTRWYGYELPESPRLTTAFSSRGCPFSCSFCADTRICGGRYRTRSAQNVLQELLQIADQGYEFVIFFDDNLTFDVRRLNELCHLVLRHDLHLRLACAGTVHTLPQSTLDLMHSAGFDLIFVGVESGSDAQLKRYGKPMGAQAIAAGLRRAKKAHIVTIASFINGAPDESDSDFQATLRFLKEVRPHVAEINPLMVHPGSRLWEELNGPEEPQSLEASFSRAIWRLPGQHESGTVKRRERLFRKAFARSGLNWRRFIEVLDLVIHNPTVRHLVTGFLGKPRILVPFLRANSPR